MDVRFSTSFDRIDNGIIQFFPINVKKLAQKLYKKINKKLKELIDFDRDVMMNFARDSFEIDLDDGVKVNYCRFRDILYPIKGLCK